MTSTTTLQYLYDAAQMLRDVDLELNPLQKELAATELRLSSLKTNVASAKERKEKCFKDFLAKRDRIAWLIAEMNAIDAQIERCGQTRTNQLDELYAAASDQTRNAELEHIAARSLDWTDRFKGRPFFYKKVITKREYGKELVRARAEIIVLERDYERAIVSYARADDEFTTVEGLWYTQKEYLATVEKRKEMVKYNLCGAAGLYAAGLFSEKRGT
jgi:hypothetical protein